MTGRRVLVAGSYPPVPLPEADATAAAVAALTAQGDVVEVLAPRPCAAHHTASFHSWHGALALARLARRFDVVILRLERGFPLPARAGRLRRASVLASLGLALRAARHAVVHIDDLGVVPRPLGGAAGGMLWRAAGSVVVASEAERGALLGLTRLDGRRVVVELPPRVVVTGLPDPGKLTPGAGRDEVMLLVAGRARIERARAAEWSGTRPPVDPLGPAAASFSRRLAKRVLRRILGPSAPVLAARARRLRGRA